MIRNLWVGLNLIVATVPLSLVVIVASLVGARDSLYDRVPRWWARWLLWASNVRVTVIGAEHVARDRPQVIASNHSSWYDVLALAAHIPKRYRFVAKQELRRIPLFGRAWQAAGHIAVDRRDTQRAVAALDEAGRMIHNDNSAIIIFPEGTRSPTGALLPFKKGAFMLALHNGVDIVPAAVQGAHAIMPKHSWRLRPGPIIVRFGPPIPTAGFDMRQRDQLIARVRSQIEALLAAPVLDTREEDVDHHQHTRP